MLEACVPWPLESAALFSKLAPPTTPYYPPPQAPPPPQPETTVHVNSLLEALSIARLDKDDIWLAIDLSESIPFKYRLLTKEIIRAHEFDTWATVPESQKVLVEGDSNLESGQAGSAVSFFHICRLNTAPYSAARQGRPNTMSGIFDISAANSTSFIAT